MRVDRVPFLIGRGSETGNHLLLPDRRISRECAALVYECSEFRLQDRGQRRGLFVNGQKVMAESHALREGDAINFGLADSFELIFHSGAGESLPQILDRMEHITTLESSGVGLRKLSVLLEATALLHSHLPLDSVLATMMDHAIGVTDADRGLLLNPELSGALRVRVARQRGGRTLPTEDLLPSQTAIRAALEQRCALVTEDVAQAELGIREARSIIAQQLRSVVVIPLYSVQQSSASQMFETVVRGELLGVLYLDSRRPAAFSTLERQILDALGVEAASVIDNARLLERERERQRLEQEISIAREIQQALLPRELGICPYLEVTGMNQSCLEVGGDYFDLLPLEQDRTAFLIADVSGKGYGAALLTAMLQGAISGMTIGHQPAEVFAHVNRFLCDRSQLQRYATMFFGVVDRAGRLEFINAGHPSPCLLRDGSAEFAFAAESFPVGLVPDAEFKSSTFQLRPGDTLVLFSDGVTEAKSPDDEEFGYARLKVVLQQLVGTPVSKLESAILEAVKEFTRGAGQADDLTLLVIQ